MVATAISGRPGSNFFKKYESAMQKRPLQTKMATCVVGFGLGDVVAQTSCWFKAPLLPDMPRRNFFKDLDYTRIVRMGAFGGLLSAPQMHVFFSWLDKVVMPMAPKHPLAILTKVGADQLFNSPIGTASFFMWTQTMKGQPQQGLTEIGDKLWPTTLIAWRLWPAAQAINFLMVPAHLRIVYINVVAIAWTTILSSLAN